MPKTAQYYCGSSPEVLQCLREQKLQRLKLSVQNLIGNKHAIRVGHIFKLSHTHCGVPFNTCTDMFSLTLVSIWPANTFHAKCITTFQLLGENVTGNCNRIHIRKKSYILSLLSTNKQKHFQCSCAWRILNKNKIETQSQMILSLLFGEIPNKHHHFLFFIFYYYYFIFLYDYLGRMSARYTFSKRSLTNSLTYI